MLQELKIRNFKSFRDEVELSFEPTGNDRYNSVVTMPDGVNLLRLAVVERVAEAYKACSLS